jgi:hypothetical protein
MARDLRSTGESAGEVLLQLVPEVCWSVKAKSIASRVEGELMRRPAATSSFLLPRRLPSRFPFSRTTSWLPRVTLGDTIGLRTPPETV